MNKTLFRLVASLSIIAFFILLTSSRVEKSINSYHQQLNTSGPGAGLTGAPGENNCTACHGGSVQDGNLGMNVLRIVSGENEYDLNSTISIELEMTDGAVKNGFQLVALDENNEMAGSFTISDATHTQLRNSAGLGRQYVTHTASGSSKSSWIFDWNTPDQLEKVTFYVATNKTNNLNNSSGDVIYLSQHELSSSGNLSVNEATHTFSPIQFGYNQSHHSVMVEFDMQQEARLSFNLIDLNGRSVYTTSMGDYFPGNVKEKIALPQDLLPGIYVATLFINNQPYSGKIMVAR